MPLKHFVRITSESQRNLAINYPKNEVWFSLITLKDVGDAGKDKIALKDLMNEKQQKLHLKQQRSFLLGRISLKVFLHEDSQKSRHGEEERI